MFDDKQLNETYPTLAKYTEGVKTAEREIVGRDYEINQLMAALNRPELCNALLLAPPGSGKALANGTPIPVADARRYVPIEKLVAGKDRVFDEEGEPQDVEGVFPQGLKRAFRLVLEDGSALVLNDEHLQNARRGGEAQDLVTAFEEARTAQEENPTPETLVAMRDAARALWAEHKTVTVRDILDSPDGSDWFVPSGFGVERGLTSEALVEHLSDKDHTATQAIEEAAMLRLSDRARFVMNSVSPDGRTGWLFTHDRDFAEAVRSTLASAGTRCDVGSFVDSHGHGYRIRPQRHWRAELRVVSITDLGREEEMTCIKVSGESSLFQAGRDHVVTHNTALVQAAALADTERVYMEVDLAKMISGLASSDEMAPLIKQLFDEAEEYSKGEKAQLVLFLDEFHQIVQLSPAAVEALKPVLAASGARGIRVIAATTDEEFDKWIKPNQPLVERLQRIIVNPPDKATTIKILRGMAKRYEVEDHFYDDHLFETIHEYTERYMPASTQPRKSILVLDSMVGWHRHTGRDIDRSLLADVLMESLGVNVAFRVDAARIKEDLDSKVYSQHWATEQVAKRLQLCVADLHDKTKPTSSFLFTGSTGTGKSTTDDTMIPVYIADGSVAWKRAGDLVAGDKVFKRDGGVQDVLGVFPQGERDIYRVTLGDGRTLDVSDNHLWGVVSAKRSRAEGLTIYSTQTLINKGLTTRGRDGREAMKYFIPMNGAVQWPEAQYDVHPYVLGALIGNGGLTLNHLYFSSVDEESVNKVAELLGNFSARKEGESNHNWVFDIGVARGSGRARLQTKDALASVPELIGKYSHEKRIPEAYMHGSIEQRWELVQGLFDTNGCIGQADGDRFNVSYSTVSEGLAHDVQQLLFSLGVASSINVNKRERDGRLLVEYTVRVKSKNDGKDRFFSLSRKLEIAKRAKGVNKQREKSFDYVGIRSIEKLPYQESATCIYVSDDEHLYQAGQFIVTHNTELTKQLAHLLFGDATKHFIRFDMTEYALEESLATFRHELTSRVWHTSHAVLLFDEIEKAHAVVTRMLLQVLDDGRLSDANGRQVSFLNTYIVLTTNAASEIYETIAQYDASDTGSGEAMKGRMKEIRRSLTSTTGGNKFPPELLGRIDVIVPFQPLSRETQNKIVARKMRQLRQEVMTKHGIRLIFDPRVLTYLVEDKADTDSNAGGARVAIARLTEDVSTAVAAFINAHPGVRTIQVDIEGELVSENKDRLAHEAKVRVSVPRD